MASSTSSNRNQLDLAVIKQPLNSGATFECHRNNVFRVPADVLVVSSNGSVEACAREKVGFTEWDKKKFRNGSYIFYDWKRAFKIPICERKPKFSFNSVYSVLVPVFDGKKWLNDFEKMIKKQLNEADKEKSSSITIPLLGTNAGGAPKDGCVRRVIDAVISIKKFQHLSKINLVVQDWPEFTLVQDIMAKQFKNTSDSEKYKNIDQAKRKSHLFSSSSHNHVSGGSKTRSRSSDKLKTGNRFDLSDQHSNTDSGDKSRGDNAQSLHRSKSPESRSVKNSSSHSREDDHRFERQTSEEISLSISLSSSDVRSSSSGWSQPTSARDDGGIQDVPGFSLNGASASNRDGYGANGSYDYGAMGANTERKHHQTRDKVEGTSLSCRTTSYDNSKEDQHHVSKSYNKEEENEEFSREYAASHNALSENNRKHQHNSDDKYFPDHKQFPVEGPFLSYGEFDKERLEELKEREESDNKDLNDSSDESHLVESSYQNGNFNRQGSYDKDYIKHEENNMQGASCITTEGSDRRNWLKNCSHSQLMRRLPCNHEYCVLCCPYNPVCQQCKAVKNDEETDKRYENGDDLALPSNTVQNDIQGATSISTSTRHWCRNCSSYRYTKYEFPCSHVYCIVCKPLDGCVICKEVDAKPKNRDGNDDDSTDRVQKSYEMTHEGNLCKNCLKMTFGEMIKLPCQHFYCVLCKGYGRCCQQCPIVSEQLKNRDGNGVDSSNKAQTTIEHTREDPEGNKVQRSSEITHEDRRYKTMDEKFCQRCHSSLKNRSQNQQRCGHTFCLKCSSIGCKDGICIGDPEGNKVQRSITYEEGIEKTLEIKCYKCNSSLKNKSQNQLRCGHTFCSKCSSYGCKDGICIGDAEGNKVQRSITYEEGSEKTLEIKCYKCNSSLKNRSQNQLRCGHTFCSKCSSIGCKDRICIENPEGNKVQRSSEITLEDRRHKTMDEISQEKCYGCNSSLTHNSPVQLACGHTFCARCASKGCKNPSCEEESYDDDHQAESISSKKTSGNHSNQDSLKGDYENNDKRMDSKNNGRNYRDDGGHDYKDDKMGCHRKKKGRDDEVVDNHNSKRGRSKGEGRDNKDQHAVGAEKAPICAICMDDITDPKTLDKCGHVFCRKCIKDSFKLHKPVCPSCGTIYGITIGNMPAGNMNVLKSTSSIEGYREYGSYCINYSFSSGRQGKEHPNPGVMYFTTSRVAYLPASPEGIEVCKMLKVAFKRRLTFTIGRSTTTGKENVITWNDIHHKTSMSGGPTYFGYPDPTYLSRVKDELASKGVTVADIGGMSEWNETIYIP